MQACLTFVQVYLRCSFIFSTKWCVGCVMVSLGMFLSWRLFWGALYLLLMNICGLKASLYYGGIHLSKNIALFWLMLFWVKFSPAPMPSFQSKPCKFCNNKSKTWQLQLLVLLCVRSDRDRQVPNTSGYSFAFSAGCRRFFQIGARNAKFSVPFLLSCWTQQSYGVDVLTLDCLWTVENTHLKCAQYFLL